MLIPLGFPEVILRIKDVLKTPPVYILNGKKKIIFMRMKPQAKFTIHKRTKK